MFTETSNLRRIRIAVCVIEHSPLIFSHVFHVLQTEPQIKVCTPPLELENCGSVDICVFVVDRRTISVPLSQLSLQSDVQYPGGKILVIDHALSTVELCTILLSGAHGFVSYEEIETNLLAAIRTVANGRLRIAPEVLEVFSLYFRSTLKRKRRSSLTERERSIAEPVGRQLSNKEIASALQITESTVKFIWAIFSASWEYGPGKLFPSLFPEKRPEAGHYWLEGNAEAEARMSRAYLPDHTLSQRSY
jgi:DNA-binding NarL/FixJ family response regulator